MYDSKEIISYLQANKILALKLDNAVAGVRQQTSDLFETIGAGATRALYYTSCFTEEYNDVCQQQKAEDLRFRDVAFRLLGNRDLAYDILKIYFDVLLSFKTSQELERIRRLLMRVNVHIASSYLNRAGFTLAIASSARLGLNLSKEFSALVGRWASSGKIGFGFYGIVQKAADSANRLRIQYPAFYSALYAKKLEMIYFLIEPRLQRAGALNAKWASDSEIASIIARLVR